MQKKIRSIAAALGIMICLGSQVSEAKKTAAKKRAPQEKRMPQAEILLSEIKKKPGFKDNIDEVCAMAEEIELFGIKKTDFFSCVASESTTIDQRVYHAFRKAKRKPESYEEYRKRHGIPQLTRMAANFKENNIRLMLEIENTFNVNPDYTIAILAIESHCGTYTPKFKAFSSLLTQYLLIPERRRFAIDEITSLIALCNERKTNPTSLSSSYAGALGYAQFIPSSFRKYHIGDDFDSARSDLFSTDDAAYSIAYYLKEHGWSGKEADADTTLKREDQNYESIFLFNNSHRYVRLVSEIANNIRQKPENKTKTAQAIAAE